jgi:hypothetical protein
MATKVATRSMAHLACTTLVAPILFMAGCIHLDDPKAYQPIDASAGTGRVCLYRTAPRISSGAWQDWILDGRSSGEIRPDRYSCLETHAGRHVVRVSIGPEKLEFFLERDQRVFVRFDVDGSRIHPVLVDQQTAQLEFRRRGYDIDRSDGGPSP